MVWWICKVMMMTNGAKPTLEKNEVFSSEITIENDYYKNMGFVVISVFNTIFFISCASLCIMM
jgi:hypothetical protein